VLFLSILTLLRAVEDYCENLGDANFMFKKIGKGIYVIGFSYPVVPNGKARIRVQISAAHSTTDIDRTIEAFTAVGRELGVVQ